MTDESLSSSGSMLSSDSLDLVLRLGLTNDDNLDVSIGKRLIGRSISLWEIRFDLVPSSRCTKFAEITYLAVVGQSKRLIPSIGHLVFIFVSQNIYQKLVTGFSYRTSGYPIILLMVLLSIPYVRRYYAVGSIPIYYIYLLMRYLRLLIMFLSYIRCP